MFAEPLQQVDRTFVLWKGRRLVYFGGCDYLRLSSDPRILQAVRGGLESFGLNVSASRKTTGNHALYEEVERQTAKFFKAERAVLVSNGYLTNLAVAQGLDISEAFVDERAHSSLHDAVLMGGFKRRLIKHRNPNDAARRLPKVDRERTALLTDGMFAHDGSVAPLAEFREVLGPDALLWVDDSHSGGVLGHEGRGAIEFCGINRKKVVQTVTFSKAFGVYGGAILCSRGIAERIAERSRIATGNTPLPLPLAGGILKALEIVREEPELRERLRENIGLIKGMLGLEPVPSPIISLSPEPSVATKLKRALLAAGIFPSFIRYPGAIEGSYLRLAISSEHTQQQLESLGRVLIKFGEGSFQRA